MIYNTIVNQDCLSELKYYLYVQRARYIDAVLRQDGIVYISMHNTTGFPLLEIQDAISLVNQDTFFAFYLKNKRGSIFGDVFSINITKEYIFISSNIFEIVALHHSDYYKMIF